MSPPNTRRSPALVAPGRCTADDQDAESAHQPKSPGRRIPPSARASASAPDGRHTKTWHLDYLCPHCGARHGGRVRSLEEIGPEPVGRQRRAGRRKSRCGRIIWLIVARLYGVRLAEAPPAAIPAQREAS